MSTAGRRFGLVTTTRSAELASDYRLCAFAVGSDPDRCFFTARAVDYEMPVKSITAFKVDRVTRLQLGRTDLY